MTRGPYSIIPDSMKPEALRLQSFEPLDFSLLKGLFIAYGNTDLSRPQLVEAIRDWQITEAWRQA